MTVEGKTVAVTDVLIKRNVSVTQYHIYQAYIYQVLSSVITISNINNIICVYKMIIQDFEINIYLKSNQITVVNAKKRTSYFTLATRLISFFFFHLHVLKNKRITDLLRPRSRKRKSSKKSTKPDIFESHISIITLQFIPSVHAKINDIFLRERAFNKAKLSYSLLHVAPSKVQPNIMSAKR